MRKVVLFLHQSLDGYCATKERALNWVPYNEAFQTYADKIVETVGSPMYGRVTYELMKSYWPSVLQNEHASARDKQHAEWINNIEKIVFSTTPLDTDWNNTTIISENIEEALKSLKEKEGKDLVIFGSPTLARSLMDLNIIDEFQFTISPVILGEGLTFIRDIQRQVLLELLHSEEIEGGMVGLHYKVLHL